MTQTLSFTQLLSPKEQNPRAGLYPVGKAGVFIIWSSTSRFHRVLVLPPLPVVDTGVNTTRYDSIGLGEPMSPAPGTAISSSRGIGCVGEGGHVKIKVCMSQFRAEWIREEGERYEIRSSEHLGLGRI